MPSLLASLGLNASGFSSGLQHARSEAAMTGKEIGSSLGDFVGDKLGRLASVVGIEETIRRTVEFGEKVFDLSNRLGISTEAIQQWDYALKLNGSSMESAAGFFEKLAIARLKAMQGSESQIDSFKRLGITLEALRSERLEDIGKRIAEAFQAGDPQKLIADLRTVGGRGAGEMVAAFRNGLAEELGNAPIIANDAIDQLKAMADDAKKVWMGFVADVAPIITGLYKVIKETLFGIATGFVATAEAASTFAKTLRQEGIAGILSGGGIQRAGFAAGKQFLDTFGEAQTGKAFAEQDEKTRRDLRRAQGFTGGADEVETAKIKKDAAEEEKKVARLKEDLSKKDRQNAYDELATVEKIAYLRERIAGLVELGTSGYGKESDRLQNLVDAEDAAKELEKQQKQLEKESKFTVFKEDLTANQRIGAFAAGPQTAILDTQKQSERHLAKLVQILESGGKGHEVRAMHGKGTHFD